MPRAGTRGDLPDDVVPIEVAAQITFVDRPELASPPVNDHDETTR